MLGKTNPRSGGRLAGASRPPAGGASIHTAQLCDASAFDYLVALPRHAEAAAARPAYRMPWRYAAARDRLGAALAPPAPVPQA